MMNYEQATEVLKRREKITRGGRVFQFQRALMDVTDPENPKRVSFFEEGEEGDRVLYENFEEWKNAEDWETPEGKEARLAAEEAERARLEAEEAARIATEEAARREEEILRAASVDSIVGDETVSAAIDALPDELAKSESDVAPAIAPTNENETAIEDDKPTATSLDEADANLTGSDTDPDT